MKLKTSTIIKLVVVVFIVGAVGVLGYVYSKNMPKTSVKLEDPIKYSKSMSSEKPEEFIALMAQDTGGVISGETYVTVYNQNLALVKEGRELDLAEGYNQVKYKDVPSQINPSSVIFKDLENEDTEVLEQTYEYDLVSFSKLLEKYLGKDLTVYSKVDNGSKEYKGKLLSYIDGITLETGDGVVSVRDPESVQFAKLPEGLITKPTLVWSLFASKAGKRQTQTTYLTGGLTWSADYVAKVNKDDNLVDIKGWTTINNTSGTQYPNATLKLVAGDVNIIQPPAPQKYYDMAVPMAEEAVSSGGGYTQESFFEYHLYTLGRKTNIKDNEQKQISLMNVKDVPVKKVFVYDSAKSFDKIRVMLETKNSKDNGLGIPLPKGIIRVYKEDSQGALQFIGEDQIDHTPEDEDIKVFMGNAFDIAVEKRTMESKGAGSILSYGSRCQYQDIEVELRNHKKEDIEVKVIDTFWGIDIATSNSNYAQTKKDEFTYETLVPVKAGETNTLKYTVRQCW